MIDLSGVVVIPDVNHEIAFYSRTWDCGAFKKLNCKLNLLTF